MSVLLEAPAAQPRRRQAPAPDAKPADAKDEPKPAPKVHTASVDAGPLLGSVIGREGRTVREIEAKSGAKLRTEKGSTVVYITAHSEKALKAALEGVESALDAARRREAIRAQAAATPAPPPRLSTEPVRPNRPSTAAAMPSCLAGLMGAPKPSPGSVPHADVFRGIAPPATAKREPSRAATSAPLLPPAPLSPATVDDASVRSALDTLCAALDGLRTSASSITAAASAMHGGCVLQASPGWLHGSW